MARTAKSKKGKAVTLQDNLSSEEEQDEGSPQGPKGTSHVRTAENMLNASRKRREAKRKVIETEHQQRVEKVRAKIESFYEDRRAKVAQMQDAQWEKLGALLKTRKSIEKVIFSHVKLIEQATLNMSNELDAMYTARLEDIVELDTTGQTMEGT